MGRRIILLSGPIASGKSTLGGLLVDRFAVQRLVTRDLLRAHVPDLERRLLQNAGDKLDRQTKGRWVADALVRLVGDFDESAMIVVDSVRTVAQADEVRRAFGSVVTHVHLSAPVGVLASRYKRRRGPIRELKSYAAVRENATERGVEELCDIADVVIDTNRHRPEDVVVRVAARLSLYGKTVDRLVDVIVGGQFGSEGKGHVVSFLAPEYDILVRVGGPNAGHKVFLEPAPVTFHQLPSGTLHSERARLLIGPGAVLRVSNLLDEIAEHQVSAERLSIDPQAMIIEDADVRFEGRTLVGSIGSTGQGVGAATARKVLRNARRPSVRLAKDIKELKPYVRSAERILEDAFARGQRVMLEGTQGTGLSLHHGNYPHVTSRETTASGCLGEAGIAATRVRRVIMVCRTYPIRVQSPQGATSGPMSRELSWQEVARRSGLPIASLKKTERTSTTNRKRRVGEFDWQLLRSAASLNGATDIALTFADYLSKENMRARRFEQLTDETIRFIEGVESVACAPVSLIATRFHHRSIIDRRAW